MASDRELTEFRRRINNLAVVEDAAVDGMVDNNTPNPRQDITTIRTFHDYVPDFFKAVPVILSYTILSPLMIFTLTAIATKLTHAPSSVQFCLNRIAIIHYAAEVAHITGV
ncbi:uncharacterized protein HMPREF1541_00982 [Cyphellophora europaea CBS 101466]|uniref:Uncharacterized protein n=1 Tax=Cyphellophora europaea (strain CBS 101466) TaxID=1220924 RepID=W2SFH5_CYPE1|nr:uncharacterized protein HMPREF1541_00982 [Cyphellophora europaea CBS 101466]ETN46793.1 hypothetical protein HMPREF1541_00982 [Cyphellophora europaea CBS 101466]